LVAVEIIGDLLDVSADLGPLVADQLPQVIAADPGDVGDLQHLACGQREHVQRRPRLPVISDPSCGRARLDHRPSQQGYENFRRRFHGYAEKISVAFDAADRDESIRLRRETFGDAFTPARW
jgi:hypothetical protein